MDPISIFPAAASYMYLYTLMPKLKSPSYRIGSIPRKAFLPVFCLSLPKSLTCLWPPSSVLISSSEASIQHLSICITSFNHETIVPARAELSNQNTNYNPFSICSLLPLRSPGRRGSRRHLLQATLPCYLESPPTPAHMQPISLRAEFAYDLSHSSTYRPAALSFPSSLLHCCPTEFASQPNHFTTVGGLSPRRVGIGAVRRKPRMLS